MVVLAEPVVADSPAEALAARLDEPRVANALNEVLNHADLLALLLDGLDGFISRGDTIADSLASGVSELRRAERPAGVEVGQLIALAQKLPALITPLMDSLPLLERLLNSDLTDPRVLELGSMVSRAAVQGAEQARSQDSPILGLRAILRALKDEDVGRALAFVVAIAKSLGQQLQSIEGSSR